MKKIIADIVKRQDGYFWPRFYCISDSGDVDRAVTDTLLDLLQTSIPNDGDLEKYVLLAETGKYVSSNLSLPDWGVDDINIWLVAPMAQPEHVCISNENTGDFSVAEGAPQQFTYEQFRVALKHLREFRERIAKEGKENLVGRRYETTLP